MAPGEIGVFRRGHEPVLQAELGHLPMAVFHGAAERGVAPFVRGVHPAAGGKGDAHTVFVVPGRIDAQAFVR